MCSVGKPRTVGAVADELQQNRRDERGGFGKVETDSARQALLRQGTSGVKRELVDFSRREIHFECECECECAVGSVKFFAITVALGLVKLFANAESIKLLAAAVASGSSWGSALGFDIQPDINRTPGGRSANLRGTLLRSF